MAGTHTCGHGTKPLAFSKGTVELFHVGQCLLRPATMLTEDGFDFVANRLLKFGMGGKIKEGIGDANNRGVDCGIVDVEHSDA